MSTQGIIMRKNGFGTVEWGLTVSDSQNNKDILDRNYRDRWTVDNLFERMKYQDIDVLGETIESTDFYPRNLSNGYKGNYDLKLIVEKYSDWRDYVAPKPSQGHGFCSLEFVSVWDGSYWKHFDVKPCRTYEYESFLKYLRTI